MDIWNTIKQSNIEISELSEGDRDREKAKIILRSNVKKIPKLVKGH